MFRNYGHRAEVFVAEVRRSPSERVKWRERLMSIRSGLRSRLRARMPDRPSVARGAAEHVPVRDWVSVSPGQPTRLLGFDQALVWVVVGCSRSAW